MWHWAHGDEFWLLFIAVGTNADKHARQKAHRDRLAQAQAEQAAKEQRNRMYMIIGSIVIVVGLIVAIVVLAGGGDDDPADVVDQDDTTQDDLTPTDSTPDPVDEPEIPVDIPEGVELPDPPAGITLTEATTCPPANGSPERVQKFAGPPPECLEDGIEYSAVLHTSHGDITVALDRDAAPVTVNNFVVLSRYQFYNGVAFHRIVPDFVLQVGDGDGMANGQWGNNDLGYSIEDELPSSSSEYIDYSLAMANAGANTNGSQFFIVLPGGGSMLTPSYSLFGQVTDGTDVVDAIGQLGTPSQQPSEVVLIESITIEETPA